VLVLGRIAIMLALVFSLAGVAFLALGLRHRSRELIRSGYFAAYGMFLSVAVACAVLLYAFIARDFSFQYVYENSAAGLSAFYRVAGFWAGQQGSFLLWLLLLSTVTAIIALRNVRDGDRLTGGAVMALCIVGAAFATLMVFDPGSRPFTATPAGEGSPFGLNPLLLHPAMVLHPPALFLGYVGLTVPFAFAVSALLLGQPDRIWARLSQKWTVAGWLFLSLGIGLGAWWAYVVLSWGGYWGWDPVENTSLIPWLTATALLHSMNLYVKRGIFRRWTIALAAATLWLTLVATWTTRSGVISSVHAFEKRQTLVDILSTFVIAVALASIALIVWRWRRFREDHHIGAFASRDFMHHLTNVGLTLFAGALLFATVIVPLASANTRSVAPRTYSAFAQPLGVLVLLAIGICPLLSWGGTDGRAFWRLVRWPLLATLLSVPVFWLTGSWKTSLSGFVGLLVCVFTAAAVLEFVVLRARRAAGEAGFARGLGRFLALSRGRTAGIVAHLGMVLIMVGLLGSNVYKVEKAVLIDAKPGASAGLKGYTLTFTGYRQSPGPQNAQRTFATFSVTRGGHEVGVLEPHTDAYPSSQLAVRAVILGSMGQDLFVTPNAPFGTSTSQLSLQMDIFPLVRLVWIGALALVAGAGVSLWPKRVAVRSAETAAEPAEA
jgi:cytochrome c-type biogenesis protein CcmF